VQTTGTTPHRGQQHGLIRLRKLCRTSRAWRILQSLETLSHVAFEPAPYRGFALADNGRDLWDLESLFRRQQNYLRPGPSSGIFGGVIQVIEFLALHCCQKWYLDWSHTSRRPDIPHCLVHFHEYSAIKSYIRFAEELKQALMLLGEVHYQGVPLPRDAEHMNADKVMEHPTCCGVLHQFALLVGKCRVVVQEDLTDAVL
jgi:hypothetical protein